MMISQQDYFREQLEASAETIQAFREQIDNYRALLAERDEQIWRLEQRLFALRYPEMWARIVADPEQSAILGVTIDVGVES